VDDRAAVPERRVDARALQDDEDGLNENQLSGFEITHANGHYRVEQTLYEQSAEAMWIGAYKAFHHDTHTSDLITRIDDEKGATLKIIRR